MATSQIAKAGKTTIVTSTTLPKKLTRALLIISNFPFSDIVDVLAEDAPGVGRRPLAVYFKVVDVGIKHGTHRGTGRQRGVGLAIILDLVPRIDADSEAITVRLRLIPSILEVGAGVSA